MTLSPKLRNRWDMPAPVSEARGSWAYGPRGPALSGHREGPTLNQEPKGEGVGQQTGIPDAAGLGQHTGIPDAAGLGHHLRGHATCTDFFKPSDGDSSSQEAVRPGQRRAACTARLLLPAGPDPPPQLTPRSPKPRLLRGARCDGAAQPAHYSALREGTVLS